MENLTKEQIAQKNPDPPWRSRLVRIAYISKMLGSCIISSDFRVPDGMGSAITLTDEGSRVMAEAVSKKKIPAKDARLMCLLELFHRDLLVDVRGVDLDALEKSISEQVRTSKIRFAPVLGRILYDRAAELFEDVEDYLTV